MSIVLDLQKNIINNKSITDLLRESLLIASKLKLYDFRDWINSELKGYDSDNVPTYRIVRSELRFFNPYQGWQPTTIVDIETDNLFNNQNIQQSISELENIVYNSNDSELVSKFSGQRKKVIMDFFETDFEPNSFIGKTQIVGIVEQVKTALLEWSIKLEEEGIIGDANMSFSNEEKNKAQKSIHIENFNGVMGDIGNIGNVSTGDHNQNIATINNTLNTKIDTIIELIEKLPLSDKKEIIHEINENRGDKEALTKTLGNLITKGSEVATILPAIGELLGLLG